MSEKKEKTLWGVICVLLILIGGVFTFYSARMLKNNNVFAKETDKALTGKVMLKGESVFDTREIGFDIYPGYKGIQMFTVSPLEDGNGIYELDLRSNIQPELISHLKVSIYKTSDTAINYLYRNEEESIVDDVVVSKNDVVTTEGTLNLIYEGYLSNLDTVIIDQERFDIEDGIFINPAVLPDNEYTYYIVYEYTEDENFNNQDYDFSTSLELKHVYSLSEVQ